MPEMKDKYKPRNWKAYNESLCRRGSLVLQLEESIYRHWRDMSQLRKVVGEKQYSDLVMEFCLTIKADSGQASGAVKTSETTRDLVLDFHHSDVPLGEVIIKGHFKIAEEPQNIVSVIAKVFYQVSRLCFFYRGLFSFSGELDEDWL